MYSYCREAYETGVSPIRAPLLEFPADEALYVASNQSSYQFLSGEWLLVAPVYEAGAVTRDGIFLPAGALWADWDDGTLFAGGQTLDAYPAPLTKLPLFVRSGAIVPMWPAMNSFDAAPADPMYLELWPAGSTSFTLYEDDGITRDALPPTSAFAKTRISVDAPATYLNGSSAANVTIAVAGAVGTYKGQLAARGWWLNVRTRHAPLDVVLAVGGGAPAVLPEMQSETELEYSPAGWFHDTSLQNGLLMVKVPSVAAAQGFVVTLSNGPSYPHIGVETCDTPAHHQVENQKFQFNAATGKIAVLPDLTTCLTVGKDKDPDSHTPAVEVQACAPALDAQQQFALVAASGQFALKVDASQCLDNDASVNRLITYSCHDPSSPGNQAWSVDAATSHIVNKDSGDCMYVIPAA